MTKWEIKRAAKLFEFAQVASYDTGGASNIIEGEVMELAIENARKKLNRNGYGGLELASISACIEAAQEEYKCKRKAIKS